MSTHREAEESLLRHVGVVLQDVGSLLATNEVSQAGDQILRDVASGKLLGIERLNRLWRAHRTLRDLLDKGALNMALADAETPREVALYAERRTAAERALTRIEAYMTLRDAAEAKADPDPAGFERAPTRYTQHGRETIDWIRDRSHIWATELLCQMQEDARKGEIPDMQTFVADRLFAFFCEATADVYQDRLGAKGDPELDAKKARWFWDPDPRTNRADFEPYQPQPWKPRPL